MAETILSNSKKMENGCEGGKGDTYCMQRHIIEHFIIRLHLWLNLPSPSFSWNLFRQIDNFKARRCNPIVIKTKVLDIFIISW